MSNQSGEPILMANGRDGNGLVARGSCDVFIVRMPFYVEYGIAVGRDHGSLWFYANDCQHEYTERLKRPIP